MTKPVNVVCMKWGTKFPANDVNVLYNMVKRHLTLPFRFVCLTDDTTGLDENIEHLPLPDVHVPAAFDVSPWRKLGMFSKKIGDLSGKTLFLDLDVVITDNIDCFFSYSEKFTIIENWTQAGRGIGNSSVYCFELGAHTDVLENYEKNTEEVLNNFRNEQIYLSKFIGDIDFWPAEWCRSFKIHCRAQWPLRYFLTPTLPAGCKIAVFHGDPKPEDAIEGGFHGGWRKYTRPAPWVAKHWR